MPEPEMGLTKDGLRLPSWIAGPLLIAAIAAGATGLITASGLAEDVDAVKAEQDKQKQQVQDVRERVVRIESKVEAIEDKLDEQKAVLEEIRKEVTKP